MHPLGVQNGGGRSNRDQFCPALRYRPVCRVFWRSARQCLRRERDHGRIGLEDEGGGSSCGPDHRCANPVFRHSVRAGFVDGGSHWSPSAYQCCTFRGSVVALDIATGKQIWKSYTIPEAPRPTKQNATGTQLYGPSGAAVWSAPTIDVQRQALYVATGDNYSDPSSETSDAILAFELATGRMLWHWQATAKDSFITSCFSADRTNCPESDGPDHDFGQSPILVSLRSGQRVLVVGQKSGVVHALDPDQEGKILWQTRVGKGGPLGGIMWGSAADQDHVYVANSDVRFSPGGYKTLDPNAGGGLFALDLATGKISMQVPPVSCGSRSRCSPALSAAVTAIPGVVFSGGVSGYLRAYATDDARLLWEVDTAREYPVVNGVSARGGAMDGPGPTIVDGMLYVNSGYAQWGGLPGNVLLAFEVRNP